MTDEIDYGNQNIAIKVRGQATLQAYLKTVPPKAAAVATQAYADYLIGDSNHGLKYQPERVEHGPGNPYQWQSERQRRAFFATDGFGGGIPSKRTGTLAAGWLAEVKMNGYQVTIINRVPYADFVQGVIQQRGHWADKWRKWRDIISTNTDGALLRAKQAVARFINTHNSGTGSGE